MIVKGIRTYDGMAVLRRGTEKDFRNKTPGRWMVDIVRFGRRARPYAFFTCPHAGCGRINKVFVTRWYEDEAVGGEFPCLRCCACGRGLSVKLARFGEQFKKALKMTEGATA